MCERPLTRLWGSDVEHGESAIVNPSWRVFSVAGVRPQAGRASHRSSVRDRPGLEASATSPSRSCDSRHPGLWSRFRPGPGSPRPCPGRAFRSSHGAVPVVAWPTPGPGSSHPGPVPGCQPGVPACVHSPGGVPVGPDCPIAAVVASIPVGSAANRGPVHLGGMRRSAGRVALRPHGHPTDPSPADQPDGLRLRDRAHRPVPRVVLATRGGPRPSPWSVTSPS